MCDDSSYEHKAAVAWWPGGAGGANAPPAGLKNGGATEHMGRLKTETCNNLFFRYVNHSLGNKKKLNRQSLVGTKAQPPCNLVLLKKLHLTVSCVIRILPLRPHRFFKKVSCLNERIFVIINASAYLFQHFKKELVSQQDFKEQHATAFMIMKIRSF